MQRDFTVLTVVTAVIFIIIFALLFGGVFDTTTTEEVLTSPLASNTWNTEVISVGNPDLHNFFTGPVPNTISLRGVIGAEIGTFDVAGFYRGDGDHNEYIREGVVFSATTEIPYRVEEILIQSSDNLTESRKAAEVYMPADSFLIAVEKRGHLGDEISPRSIVETYHSPLLKTARIDSKGLFEVQYMLLGGRVSLVRIRYKE